MAGEQVVHQFKISLQATMPAVRVIHWKKPEARPLLKTCRAIRTGPLHAMLSARKQA
jgi:hypothetical protein